MQSRLITTKVDQLFRNMQPHNQARLLNNPTPPDVPSYLAGARSFMGARNRKDAFDTRYNYGENLPDIFSHITPWGVIYPGWNHKSTNTCVLIEKFRLGFLHHGSADWTIQDFYPTDNVSQGGKNLPYVNPLATGLPFYKNYDVEGMQYALNEYQSPVHFWKNGRVEIPDYKLLRGLYIECIHSLALINAQGVDDRSSSDFLLCVSADYYADATTNFLLVQPLAISSRFVKVQNYKVKTNVASVEGIGQINRNSLYTGSVLLSTQDFLNSNIEFLED